MRRTWGEEESKLTMDDEVEISDMGDMLSKNGFMEVKCDGWGATMQTGKGKE